jgi:predicted XRE-type DNA-binding protein
MATNRKTRVEIGSGNVFADIGVTSAEESLAKTRLVFHINQILKLKGLSQAQAAKILGVDQPRISDLICGRLARFSIDKLFRFLNALNQEVEIVIKAKRRSRRAAGIKVLAA